MAKDSTIIEKGDTVQDPAIVFLSAEVTNSLQQDVG